MKKQSFASYFKATAGLGTVGDVAYGDSVDPTVSFASEPQYTYSGEVGFFFTGMGAGLRAGVEFFQTEKLKEVSGTDSAGSSLLTMTSVIRAVILKGTLEFNLWEEQTQKAFVFVSGGWATATLDNSFTDEPGGALSFTDFQETGSAQVLMGDIGIGYEVLATDNTTFFTEMLYRTFQVSEFKHDNAVTNFNGARTKGQTMINQDGTNRNANLNSLALSIGFRFFISL